MWSPIPRAASLERERCGARPPKLDENGKLVRDGHGKVIYEPYRIKSLNTHQLQKSMRYNPLAYIRSEKDILKLVNVIDPNTKGDGEKSPPRIFGSKPSAFTTAPSSGTSGTRRSRRSATSSPCWTSSTPARRGRTTRTYKSPPWISCFDELEKEHPDHFAVKQYANSKWRRAKLKSHSGLLRRPPVPL